MRLRQPMAGASGAPCTVRAFVPGILPPAQIFFSGPALKKTDHAGCVGAVNRFLPDPQSVAACHGATKAFGFKDADHAPSRGVPEAIFPFGENRIQAAEAAVFIWGLSIHPSPYLFLFHS